METNLDAQYRLAEEVVARRRQEAEIDRLLQQDEEKPAKGRPLRRLAAALGARMVKAGERLRDLDEPSQAACDVC
jgi:hypothetical protein